jgi:putative toxin-antitoxin system antitoxin component (TIGR02293 family)
MPSNDGHVDAADSMRIARVARITRMAEAVFESKEQAQNWLERENIVLGNAAPASLWDTETGFDHVCRALMAIEYGNPA